LRILYITNEIPYPLQTGYVRQYRFLEALSQRHSITHYSLTWKPSISRESLEAIKPFSERLEIFGFPKPSEHWALRAIGLVPRIGMQARRGLRARMAAREMKRAILETMKRESFDLVFFSGKDTLPAIEDLKDVPIVADCCDAAFPRIRREMQFSSMARRLWLVVRYFEMKSIEKRLVRKTPYVLFGSHRDRKALLGTEKGGVVIPQGIDPRHWKRRSTAVRPNRLLFVGSMGYPPNHDAAVYLIEKILPLVQKEVPNVELFVVGRNPQPALRKVARRWPNVTITGLVEDIRPYLERAAVFVAPIRFASGIQNKILEAMAMGVPVVTTSVVAEGVRVEGDAELPLRIADDERRFAQHVVELLRSQSEREYLAFAGRRYVEANFLWSQSLNRLEKICLEAARSGRVNREGKAAENRECLQSH
jgi:glycosyltransferase involved in cell wall biosynthesis